MGQQHAFRKRRGAGGVLDQQQIVRLAHRRRLARSAGAEGRERRRGGWDIVAQHDHLTQIGQRGIGQARIQSGTDIAQHGDEVGAQKAIRYEQPGHARLPQGIGHLFGAETRIDWYRDRTGRADGEEQGDPMRAVAEAEPDVIARLHARRDQRSAQPRHLAVEFRISDAAIGRDDRFHIGRDRDSAGERIRDGQGTDGAEIHDLAASDIAREAFDAATPLAVGKAALDVLTIRCGCRS